MQPSVTAFADPQVLPYSQPPSRRIRRILVSAFVILTVIFAVIGWRWRDVLSKRGTVLYWQHQCLNYASGETLVYERGSAIQNELQLLINPDRSLPAAKGTVPNCWTQFDLAGGPFLTLPPSTLNRVPDAIAFLHERRGPSGKEYLVCVVVYSGWRMPPAGARVVIGRDVITAVAIDPAGLGGSPTVQQRPTMKSIRHLEGNPRLLSKQVFAGQPDPVDPSHFTIRYKVGKANDVLDGRVDNYGNVTLTPRNPPVNRTNEPPSIF